LIGVTESPICSRVLGTAMPIASSTKAIMISFFTIVVSPHDPTVRVQAEQAARI
jgi:hypothetical protein